MTAIAAAGAVPSLFAVTGSGASLAVHRFACGARISLRSSGTADGVAHFLISKVARAGSWVRNLAGLAQARATVC